VKGFFRNIYFSGTRKYGNNAFPFKLHLFPGSRGKVDKRKVCTKKFIFDISGIRLVNKQFERKSLFQKFILNQFDLF